MAFGAMYAGIPHSPLSPSYSLVSSDFGKLAHIVNLITPGMVFATRGNPFAKAIAQTIPADVEIVIASEPIARRSTTPFSRLLATEPTTVDRLTAR
jgi:feruloyl-CoA synthase